MLSKKRILRVVSIGVVCLFVVNSFVWANPPQVDPTRTSLGPESRLRPFFEKHGLDFRNISTVIYAARRLRDLIINERAEDVAIRREINRLNKILPDGAIRIEERIKTGALQKDNGEDVRNYPYAVFCFKDPSGNEKVINALFFSDHSQLTDYELRQLRITDVEKHYLDCPGLEGVWFVNPAAEAPTNNPASEQTIFDDVFSYKYLPESHDFRWCVGGDPASFGSMAISVQDVANPQNDERWKNLRAVLNEHITGDSYRNILQALNHIAPNAVDAMYAVNDLLIRSGHVVEPVDEISFSLKIIRLSGFIKICVRDSGNGIPCGVLEGWKAGNFESHGKNEGPEYFGKNGRGTATALNRLAAIGASIKYSTFHNGESWVFDQDSNRHITLEKGDNNEIGTEIEITIATKEPTAGDPLNIALTGATGFLGYNVSQALMADRGIRARALVRTTTRASELSKEFPRLENTVGNLVALDSLRRLIRGNRVFINVAADNSTNIRIDNVAATAEIINTNAIGPALAMMVAEQENNNMRKIFISSFDIHKLPPAAEAWIVATAEKIGAFVKEYVATGDESTKSPNALSLEIATDLKRQEFSAFSYPVSKALMDRVLLQLAKELHVQNVIILRTMGLVGEEMRKSSNSGLLIKLIDAVLDREYRPVGRKITPYNGASASLISAGDVARVLLDLAKVKLDSQQLMKPIILELGGDRITWKDVVEIVARKTQELEVAERDFMRNVAFCDPPPGFVNVEQHADKLPLSNLLNKEVSIAPIRQVIEDIVEAEFLAQTKDVSRGSLEDACKESEQIHKKNIKPEYTPTIPEKSILCHIITDSILPEAQKGMLQQLEQDMRGEEYSEKVVHFSSTDPDKFIDELRILVARQKELYRDYTVKFDVACPNTELVEEVLESDLGVKLNVKALAFEPCKEPAQVEGVILALRALYTGSLDRLCEAFEILSGNKLDLEKLDITNIDAFMRRITFILPVAKALDYDSIKELNDIIRKNIEAAA
ncbi:MAG: NAD(P)-dependent oxidoreductase [Candidatus Omnitrophica bacterium]|nr:NAD(P)-dependent oxidoreductase [Candidatus Omnitrophota bacterium]